MRHGDKNNNLSRTKEHRTALLRNLASALIREKRIVTTLAKAKALRKFIEPLVTKTKKTETQAEIQNQHRVAFSVLDNKLAVKELFTVIGPKVASRPGGYTRIIKLGTRQGDAAEMALIEFVDFNETYGAAAAKDTAKKTRRSTRRKSGAKKAAPVAEKVATEEAATTAAPEVDEAADNSTEKEEA